MAIIKHVFTNAKADLADPTIVRPSDWNSAHAITMIEGVSAGTQVGSSGTIVFADSNGVSFGMNANTITGTVRTDYQSAGAYLTTAMVSNAGSNFVAATAAFAGTSASGTIASNGISVSIGPYITTAMASNRGSDFVAATAAFAGTSASGTIGSAGISVSIGPYITTADLSANSSNYFRNWKIAGNTAGTTSSQQGTDFWLAGGQGITLSGNSNSITLSVGSYITTAMASNRGSDFVAATAAFAGTSASGTIGSAGISVSIGPYITTAMASNRGSDFVAATAAFAGTSASGTIGSAGISVSIGPYITTAMASNRGSDFVAATAAFAGTNASGTIASNGISVSVAAPGAAAENNWVTLLGANVAGSSSASGSTIGWSGINLTLSGTNNSQVVISAPATTSFVGSGAISLSVNASTITVQDVPSSYFAIHPAVSLISQSMGQSTSLVFPMCIPYQLSVSFARIMMSFSAASTSRTVQNVVTSCSGEIYSTVNLVAYSMGTGGNSESLQYVTSGQGVVTYRNYINVGAQSTEGSYTNAITFPSRGSSNSAIASNYSVSNANSYQFSTTAFHTAFTNIRYFDLPFQANLTPGAYWFCMGISSNSATNGTFFSNITGCLVRYSHHYAMSQINAAVEIQGVAANTTNALNGCGSFTLGGAAGTTSSIGMNQISRSASHPLPWIQLIRSA